MIGYKDSFHVYCNFGGWFTRWKVKHVKLGFIISIISVSKCLFTALAPNRFPCEFCSPNQLRLLTDYLGVFNFWRRCQRVHRLSPGSHWHLMLACVAAVSFPFLGGDRTSERKSERATQVFFFRTPTQFRSLHVSSWKPLLSRLIWC